MLNKLLKYDLRAVFKYWWIAAISSLALAVIGGLSIAIMENDIAEQNPTLSLFAILGMILTIIGLAAFFISAAIFVYVRFYQNFFSDEGYLTFTLPVKREQLLTSKLISAIVISMSTFFVLLADIVILILFAAGDRVFDPRMWENLFGTIQILIEKLPFIVFVYALEAFAILLLAIVFSILLVFVCISFAAMITKKNKVFAAIGIYYLVNACASFILQFFGTMGLVGGASWLTVIPEDAVTWVLALILLIVILVLAAICALLYTIELWLIDRKLNIT